MTQGDGGLALQEILHRKEVRFYNVEIVFLTFLRPHGFCVRQMIFCFYSCFVFLCGSGHGMECAWGGDFIFFLFSNSELFYCSSLLDQYFDSAQYEPKNQE